MRIYEFSKELAIATKDVLAALAEGGFEAKNHMSVLSPESIDFLRKKFATQEKKVASPVKEREKVSPKFSEKIVEKKRPSSDKVLQKSVEKKEVLMEPIVAFSDEKTTAPENILKKSEVKSVVQSAGPRSVASSVTASAAPVVVEIALKPTSVAGIAEALGRPATDIIVTLLKWGMVTSKNQIMSDAIVGRLAEHYQAKAVRPVAEEASEKKLTRGVAAKGEDFKARPPIVVVLGHVDHGKTSLLDFIRKTRVAAKEKGGITQHLGAYQVHIPQGDIIFLDTPGHEAFPKIRMRGLRVADIAVLVVAADDGVMPQTIEAIKFAKSAGVSLVVALNKVDKVDKARLEIVRRQLAQYDLLPEEWGGDVVCVPVSAKTGEGVDRLLEMIVLQSHLMELQAEMSGPGAGYVLEAKVEKGRGPIATLICQHGKVSVGDYFLCGKTSGKVTSLVNSFGERLEQAGP
ncbi:translation initiation factor IF-2, partial [Methylicorpusculum sp.]|uniref:translation initiation factor IF-2 n=1 Tax=Methylicorpusculum sp. TaxID=2713644 RepID=UPI002ABC3CDF